MALRQVLEGSDGAIHQHFNIGTAVDLVVSWPPSDEQQLIVSYVDGETAKLDTLTAETEHAITLLKERRAAPISAPLPSQEKIDVREAIDVEEVAHEREDVLAAEPPSGDRVRGGRLRCALAARGWLYAER